LKHYLSVSAAIAALAITTATGLAQTSSTVPNSNVPGSPGYSGSAPTHTTKMKGITKKQDMALNHISPSSRKPNAAVPGSPNYSGSSKPAGVAGSGGTGPTLNTLTMKRKTTTHNVPNGSVPGSDSYSGSAPKPGN